MSTINAGFTNNSPQAVDNSYGALSVGRTTPYSSLAAAVAAINIATRFRGKTVGIDLGDGSGLVEYWWRVGTADNQLVQKISGEQSIDFVVGDGGLYTPAAGSVTLTNPNLINCVILSLGGDAGGIPPIARSGFQSYGYNITSGVITLTNTKFSNGSWYTVKFRQL